MAEIKKSGLGNYDSFSQKFLENRSTVPPVSPLMANSVSAQRKSSLASEVEQGLFRDGSSTRSSLTGENVETANGRVIASSTSLKKEAQAFGGSGHGGMFKGVSGDTVKQAPEIYSPLWLNSNLSMPRDRATINAWCRSFFALNPFVHNAISLHSTYPISKLNIKCANKEIEKFFNDMIEEIDLMNVCVQIAQEYWLLGEAFIYAELNEHKGKWQRLQLQNPDFILVNRSVVASDPIIMLRPDENLKRIISSNRPADMEQRKQLPREIIDSIRRGGNIPLDNFSTSQIARRISPYETRGTGLPVCIFRQLMLMDLLRESKYAQAATMINPTTVVKIGSADYKPTFADLEAWRATFECYDEETEVLTENGFKKFNDIIDYSNEIVDENPIGQKLKASPKNIKIACFNSNNQELEYHNPSSAYVSNYNGDMYHFKNDKIDIKVTPNHKMWLSPKEYEYYGHRSLRVSKWGDWRKVQAQDISLNDYSKFRSKINWIGNDDIKFINVCDKQIPVELYLEFLGYILSEGCLYTDNKYNFTTSISQSFDKYKDDMLNCLDSFCKALDKSYSSSTTRQKNPRWSDMWSGIISGKELFYHFKDNIQGKNGGVKSFDKCMPAWIKTLSPRLLKIFIEALVKGDGSIYNRKDKTKNGFAYYSTSKQLADDVYEIVYKCGLVPTEFVRNDDNYINRDNIIRRPIYTVIWSNCGNGEYPLVYKTNRNSQTKEKNNLLNIQKYNGKIWCVEVPTGLFITRRNGKITIQGNSAQNDKDFKIFTHEGVDIQRIGWGQGIYDISGDITQLVKEIYVGLQVPSVLMDGGSDTSYANGGVALDVLRQRYMQFRNTLSQWLKRKIFAPISKIQGFYDYSGGEKQLIVPEVDWNHMSLFDVDSTINSLVQLTQGQDDQKRVSLHTLYRSLGLDFADEARKIRKEAIQNAINKKEKASLETMTLNELRALDEEDEIPEQDMAAGAAPAPSGEAPVPGEMGGSSPLPDLSLPGAPMPSPEPPAPSK